MAQFENDDAVARDLRQRSFLENNITPIVGFGWVAFTFACFYGPFKREGSKIRNILGKD